MARLELQGIGKTFAATRALEGVDLDVGPGEILGVIGPSGAGKSTLCRIVSGLEAPSAGQVRLDGAPLARVPAERRRVASMFESYALYPHLTVFENVAFPLRAPGAPRLDRPALAARVEEMLHIVELDGYGHRRPAELSGGQRQRVALCRVLVQEARAYVLDEPISHLDAKLRHVLRRTIRRRLCATSVPTIWVTPDGLEALAVADRLAVLVEGRVRQVGAPADVYRRPASIEVARLLGDPPMNLIAGALAESGGVLRFQHAGFSLSLPVTVRERLGRAAGAPPVVLGLRPAEVDLATGGAGEARGEVWVWEPLGKHGILSVRVGPDLIKVKLPLSHRFRPGEPVTLRLHAAEPSLFDGATGRAL